MTTTTTLLMLMMRRPFLGTTSRAYYAKRLHGQRPTRHRGPRNEKPQLRHQRIHIIMAHIAPTTAAPELLQALAPEGNVTLSLTVLGKWVYQASHDPPLQSQLDFVQSQRLHILTSNCFLARRAGGVAICIDVKTASNPVTYMNALGPDLRERKTPATPELQSPFSGCRSGAPA